MAPVGKLYGVGEVTAVVCKEAGMERDGDVKFREDHHHDWQIAIDRMKQITDKPAAVWRRLARRLDNHQYVLV